MRKGALLTLIIFSITINLMGCGKSPNLTASIIHAESEKDVVKIGIVEPLSGEYEEFGIREKEAIDLAHEKFSEVLGKEIQLIYADNQSQLLESKKVTEWVAEEGVVAVIGSYGDILAMGASEVCKEEDIPIIGVFCENPLVTIGNTNNFRVNPTNLLQSRIIAKYSHDIGDERVAMIKDESNKNLVAIGQAFLNDFNELVKDEKDRSVLDMGYKDKRDVAGVIEKILQYNIDSIYLLSSQEDAAGIVKMIRQAGIDAPIIGNSLWNEEKIKGDLGEMAEGITLCSFDNSDIDLTDTVENLEKEYIKKYGKDAVFNDQVMYAYDAYLLLLDAINRAHSLEGSDITKALLETRNLVVNTGVISMDENGDVIKPAIVKIIRNGEWVKKAKVDLADSL